MLTAGTIIASSTSTCAIIRRACCTVQTGAGRLAVHTKMGGITSCTAHQATSSSTIHKKQDEENKCLHGHTAASHSIYHAGWLPTPTSSTLTALHLSLCQPAHVLTVLTPSYFASVPLMCQLNILVSTSVCLIYRVQGVKIRVKTHQLCGTLSSQSDTDFKYNYHAVG